VWLVGRRYAEGVQKRLMAAGIVTELNVVTESEVILAIEDATRHRMLFAVVVTEQNEVHRSITVNILYGMAQGTTHILFTCCLRVLYIIFTR